MAVIFSLFISQAERKQGSYCFIQDKEFYGGRVSFLDRFFSIKREAIIFCENCRFGKISLYLRFRVCSSQAFCKRMKYGMDCFEISRLFDKNIFLSGSRLFNHRSNPN